MAKRRRGSSSNGDGHFVITQANLDKKGKTNKKLRLNPMATKYLTSKGKDLKEAGEKANKENQTKARERKAKLAKAL